MATNPDALNRYVVGRPIGSTTTVVVTRPTDTDAEHAGTVIGPPEAACCRTRIVVRIDAMSLVM
jgi:hypothetical protein